MEIRDPLSVFPSEKELNVLLTTTQSSAEQSTLALVAVIDELSRTVKAQQARIDDALGEVRALAVKVSMIEAEVTRLPRLRVNASHAFRPRRVFDVWPGVKYATIIAGLAIPIIAMVFVARPILGRYFRTNFPEPTVVFSPPPAHAATLTSRVNEPLPDAGAKPTPMRETTPSRFQRDRFVGTLVVNSSPSGAAVRINQRQVGLTPLRVRSQPAGTHAVWIEHEGYERWTAAVLMPAGKVTTIVARLHAETKP